MWRNPHWTWEPPQNIRGTFDWSEQRDGRVPYRAVYGGTDADGGQIFVGRAWEHNELLPAKVVPNHKCAYVSYAGREIRKVHYQVLVSSDVSWRPTAGGDIPPNAIQVGNTSSGEALFSGRALHQGIMTVGKVHPSNRCCYISYNGKEIRYGEYEIMVLN